MTTEIQVISFENDFDIQVVRKSDITGKIVFDEYITTVPDRASAMQVARIEWKRYGIKEAIIVEYVGVE